MKIRLALLATLIFSIASPTLSFAAGDRFALVIGNAKYPDADAPLKEPVNDARDVADELKRDGFTVEVGENLTGDGMRRAFDRLYGKIKPGLFRRLCTQAHNAGLLCAPSVGPGYDARLATRHEVVLPRSHGETYDRMWKSAIRADADVVTITSYNEWQEGTQIEPAQGQVGRQGYDGAWGKRGLAAQRAYLEATAGWATRLRAAVRQ